VKSFLTVKDLGRPELEALMETARDFRSRLEAKETISPLLDGVCVANAFFEPSTRTRLSFDLAAQRLGAHVITFDPDTSSVAKGESLRDTAATIAAIGADILVVRHSEEGAPAAIAGWTGLPVINGGDGTNEHPTQALLDATTITSHFEKTDGLRMVVVGDVARSRVAGSLTHVLPLLGMQVTLVGPPEWLPVDSQLPTTSDLESVLDGCDIVYLLRVQRERGGSITDGYVRDFQLDMRRLAILTDSAVVMHAGPMNRGVEIGDDVADSPRSLILEQVRNGVPSRMAVLQALAEETT
jgi:aspartate carbamoyltransferase catalytic subunit